MAEEARRWRLLYCSIAQKPQAMPIQATVAASSLAVCENRSPIGPEQCLRIAGERRWIKDPMIESKRSGTLAEHASGTFGSFGLIALAVVLVLVIDQRLVLDFDDVFVQVVDQMLHADDVVVLVELEEREMLSPVVQASMLRLPKPDVSLSRADLPRLMAKAFAYFMATLVVLGPYVVCFASCSNLWTT